MSNQNTYKNLSDDFFAAAYKYPNNNALNINGNYLTYKDLASYVNQIVNFLLQTKAPDKIGLYFNNTFSCHAASIAISAFGASVIPINTSYPKLRNQNIINLAGVTFILSDDNIEFENAFTHLIPNYLNEQINVNKPLPLYKQKISYILFTSGTTGMPKGVPITKQNTNSFFNYFANYPFNAADKFLNVYEPTFDVWFFSFYMPLYVGACCYILNSEQPKYLSIVKSLQENKITVLSVVPTFLHYIKKYFSQINLPHLKYSFFSGDCLFHSQAKEWKKCLPNGAIHNFYGPTETTIVCTKYIWNEQDSELESINDVVPLGRVFAGNDFILINEHGDITEQKGELCFTGNQVFESYLNNTYPEKFFSHNGKTYYKTGDLASLNNNGNLIFHGRIDDQIKINGYRIESSEIENLITNQFNVRSKILVKNSENSNQLCLFIESTTISTNELKNKIIQSLPEYMLPSHFLFLNEFPLNPNGKIDKTELIKLL